MSDVEAMTRGEGEALVAYLRAQPEQAWGQMTVCDPWTIEHLVAHLTAAGNQTYRNLAKGLPQSRFNLDRFVDRDLQTYLTGSTDGRIDRFEESVRNPSTPKPLKEIVFGEMICHGEDIRRALGDRGEHPAENIAQVGPMFAKTNAPLKGKMRTEGLSFRATDSEWSYGAGPEVIGPGIDLVCAMAGRPYALDQLGGEGLPTLQSRF
jgi:uncharacterized protein (TIGR03083 family)